LATRLNTVEARAEAGGFETAKMTRSGIRPRLFAKEPIA
jgi:hypothetical protein